MNTKSNILITGSNRSGSTWVGKVISSHSSVDNIIEPLNLNRIERYNKFDLHSWYLKVNDKCSQKIKEEAYSLFSYYLHTSYSDVLLNPFHSFEGHKTIISLKKRLRKASKPIKMLKDPSALFSVPWLVTEFNVYPVLLVRHPAAYVLSIKEKDWWFDFDHMLKQPHFFEDGLEHLKDEVVSFKKNEKEKSIIDNAALLWKVFYTQVDHYRIHYPQWFYITHEALSIDPITNYKAMFGYLGLDFNEKIRNYIKESTQASQQREFKRDSAKNATKWMERLTYKEQQKVYEVTKGVSDKFYESWN